MIIRDKTSNLALLFAWQGTILPTVLPALTFVVLISAVIGYLTSHHMLNVPEVPAIGFTIFGIILSIFLSFRNNACYDRWWEGRKLWGALIANSRHIARDSHVLPDRERRILMYRLMFFTHLLRNRLRKINTPFKLDTHHLALEQHALNHLDQHINAAQFVLECIQKDLVQLLRQGLISDIIYSTLNRHIVELGNIQAGCDRILSTPLPFSYSVLLHRTVYCFCFLLPFSLGQTLGLLTPFLVGLLAYTFLGLDALSTELEEPFGTQSNDLPLDSMVRLIEIELLGTLGKPTPPPIQAQDDNLL